MRNQEQTMRKGNPALVMRDILPYLIDSESLQDVDHLEILLLLVGEPFALPH